MGICRLITETHFQAPDGFLGGCCEYNSSTYFTPNRRKSASYIILSQMTEEKDLLVYSHLCSSIDLCLPRVFPLSENGCWIATIRLAARKCKQLQNTDLQPEACNYPTRRVNSTFKALDCPAHRYFPPTRSAAFKKMAARSPQGIASHSCFAANAPLIAAEISSGPASWYVHRFFECSEGMS
jgi:hypothetical protein